jgi:hypothetical protein
MERTELRGAKSYPDLEETERFYEAIPENLDLFAVAHCSRESRQMQRCDIPTILLPNFLLYEQLQDATASNRQHIYLGTSNSFRPTNSATR